MTDLAQTMPDTSYSSSATQRTTDAPLRVLLWGTYDLSKPRTRILRDGLVEIGADVVEIHADVWSSDADKSQLSKRQMIGRLLSLFVAYPMLIWRYLRAPAHDIVLVPYLGQFDVIVLWPFAKLRRAPVVLDLFLSLYDTVVQDRRIAKSSTLVARILKRLERLSCRAADRVLLDTQTHAARIAALFDLDTARFDAVPVGAEPGAFANVPPRTPHDGPVKILFYGQLIPLHGVETILQAAQSDRGRKHSWHIIGSGQDQDRVAQVLGDDTPHIQWDRWMPYEDLAEAIENADVCLGIFGISEKAASVVPNKVYQSLFANRAVITRESPAMHEIFPHEDQALHLVPAADPEALLDAVDALNDAGFPAMNTHHLETAEPREIATALCAKIAPLIRKCGA